MIRLSIWTLNSCGSITFNFRYNGKRVIIIQFIKGDKQHRKNNRTFSLLPECGKKFEKLTH